MDKISIIYKDMVILQEMAMRASDQSFLQTKEERQAMHATAHKLPLKEHIDGVLVHSNAAKTIKMGTKNGECVYYSIISKHSADDKLPFDHHHQTIVAQGGDCPRGFSRRMSLKSISDLDSPLRSSDSQSKMGHAMWKKLVEHAISSGYAVHLWDGNKMHTTTKENMNDHLSAYYGSPSNHMIISKEHHGIR